MWRVQPELHSPDLLHIPVVMSHLHTDQNCDKSEGTQNTDTCRTEEILL